MRTVLAGICVLVLWGSSPAAAQDVHGGVKAGVNFANLDFGSSVAPSVDVHTGAVFGGFLQWPVAPGVAIQPEVLFATKGASFEAIDFRADVRLRFIEVPVLVTVGVVKSGAATIRVFGGPSFGFRMSARLDANSLGFATTEDIEDQVEPFDFGLTFGGGVEVGHFVADGRYTFGLTNLNKGGLFTGTARNRVFTVLAGVRF